MFGDAGEHGRPDFSAIMERENVIRPTDPL
jgi:hypothetical protein